MIDQEKRVPIFPSVTRGGPCMYINAIHAWLRQYVPSSSSVARGGAEDRC